MKIDADIDLEDSHVPKMEVLKIQNYRSQTFSAMDFEPQHH